MKNFKPLFPALSMLCKITCDRWWISLCLKSLLPARVDPVIGVLVEPHVLDRSRYKWRPISQSRLDYEGTIAPPFANVTQSYSGSNLTYDALLMNVTGSFENQNYNIYSAELITQNASASNYFSGSDSVLDDQTVIFMVKPIQEASASSGVWMTISGSYLFGGSTRTLMPQSQSWAQEWWDSNDKTYQGYLQTEDTTTDGKSPVEVWLTNPNKLTATTLGPSKLDVE